MKRNCGRLVVWVTTVLASVAPLQTATAAPPPLMAPRGGPPVRQETRDLELGPAGRLHGQLVDRQNQPLAAQRVVVLQNGRQVTVTQTDIRGWFRLTGVSPGVYHLVTRGAVVTCRCWATGTAPPAATDAVLLVQNEAVQRGQQPLGTALFSDPVLIGLVLSGAIAIPIAVHNSRSDRPSGS